MGPSVFAEAWGRLIAHPVLCTAENRPEGLVVLTLERFRGSPAHGELDEAAANATSPRVFRDASLEDEERSPGLSFTGETADASEDQDDAPRLVEARARARCAFYHHGTTIHCISQRNTDIAPHDDQAVPESSCDPVGSGVVTYDREARRVELGGKLRSCATVNLDHRAPWPRKPGHEQALAFRTHERDPFMTLVESPGHFRIDSLIIANLGDRDQGDQSRSVAGWLRIS